MCINTEDDLVYLGDPSKPSSEVIATPDTSRIEIHYRADQIWVGKWNVLEAIYKPMHPALKGKMHCGHYIEGIERFKRHKNNLKLNKC
jgi:hypothetical protein